MSDNTRQKLGLFSCILMAIGSIIGASIFATTPVAIKIVGGNGVVLGFILAAVVVILRTFPELVMMAALPANGASYMYLSRLVHPILGALDAFNELMVGVMKIATMALTFSTYFAMLVPQIPPKVVAAAMCIIFTIISCFGIKASALVQNISVAVLLAALAIFIFGGLGATTVSFGEVISSTVELSSLWAAMGIMHGSLIGANALIYAAEEVENPGRNIPIAFAISTGLTAVLYAIMSYICVAVMPMWWEIDNLATVAGQFLPQALLFFFITGGALLAVVTSVNSAMLMFSRINFSAARDGLFPYAVCKTNKYNAPYVSLWLISAIALFFLLGGFDLDDVVKITAIPGVLLSPILFMGVFTIRKHYPNCYKNSFIKTPHWLNCVLSALAMVACFALGYYVIFEMQPHNWIAMLVYYALAVVFTVWRVRYIKKTEGVDLFEKMKSTYQPWEELEQASKAALGDKAVTR